ncbi:MAG: AzlC family ABC transporter permease [Pseudomonadota bacterium]
MHGAASAFSLPALVLMGAQVGFAALAREAGLGLGPTLLLTVGVWALPSQVVFVGLVGAGASAASVAVAVALSAVRFMPMTMAWTPVVRSADTRQWVLVVASCYVAITAWVYSMSRLPKLERPARLPFFAGFAATLTLLNAVIVVVAYNAIDAMPALVAAALVFLMPIYFVLTLWGAARSRADRIALGAGFLLGPLFSLFAAAADLLLAGFVGGTAAYVIGRLLGSQEPAA